MDRHHRLRAIQTASKSSTIGIIFLVISVAIFPCITQCAATATHTNETIEITTQVYGIKERKDTIVQLTTEQHQNLMQFLIKFRARLNQTTTSEDMTGLFKEAIHELATYGLLPQGMSTKQIYDLVKIKPRDPQILTLLQRMTTDPHLFNQTNAFCLIAGQTTKNTRFFSSLEMGCSALCWTLYYSMKMASRYTSNPILLNNTLTFVHSLQTQLRTIHTVRIIGTGLISFGYRYEAIIPPPYRYDPAQGWVTTMGLLGKKSWNDTFFGGLLLMVPFDSGSYVFYPGAVGFVGIKVNLLDGTFFFLGSSVLVRLK